MSNPISTTRGFLLGLAVLFAGAGSAPGAATEPTPTAMLQSAVEEILTVAYLAGGPGAPDTLVARMRPILDRTMDFESITRRAIGPGWRQFSAAERTRAVELFTALIVRTYAGRFTGGGRPTIEYKTAIATDPERWEVPTHVSRDGSSHEIIYRIEKRADGWRIYDIVAEGVSFVANYRSQFGALFQKGGAAAVLRALEAKQAAPSER